MLAYTTGRVVVTPAASARSNARALRTPSGATARRGAILRVRVVGGGAATRRASHVAAALGSEDDDDEGFADIDRIAEEDEAARTGSDSVGGLVAQSREDELMSIGSHEVVEFGLSGRPLYVCQSMWWLRLSQLKTYPPDALELRDYARRSGLSFERVERWFNDALDYYHALPLVDKATYADECEKKLKKMDELTAKLGEERPVMFLGRDDDPVFLDAPWNADGKLTYEEQERFTLEDPLYATMTDLPSVMAAEAEAAQQEQDVEEALDDEAIARIPQDGSVDKPFLVNPYVHSKSGTWSIEKPVGPPSQYEETETWLEAGGWDALPDHEIVSAVDGGALKYVGVNNDEHVPRDLWKLDRPAERDTLAVAEEVSSDSIVREARKYIGELGRKLLHKLEIGEELEGTVNSLELYHGALVDCGCEVDGLIPISETEWPRVRDALTLGTKVRVKVSAVHQKWWRFRFPIELKILEPDVGHLITKHPHEDGPPINIFSGETVPFAHEDAGRPLDRFQAAADVDEEALAATRKQQISDWVDLRMQETVTKDKGKVQRNRMQKAIAEALAANDLGDGKAVITPPDEDAEDDHSKIISDSGAAAALGGTSALRAMEERTEEMIAAEEEEEEAALFGSNKQVSAAGKRQDPEAVEEGDDEEEAVDTSAEDNLAMKLNPEAEDTRGGMISGVDDLGPAPGDIDDDEDGDDDDDDDVVAGAR